jgi:hypothetical protein
MKNNIFVRAGSFVLLIIGALISLTLLLAGVVMFFYFPDASMLKKAMIGGAFIIVGLIIALLTISLFESMREILKVEREILELEDEVGKGHEGIGNQS